MYDFLNLNTEWDIDIKSGMGIKSPQVYLEKNFKSSNCRELRVEFFFLISKTREY